MLRLWVAGISTMSGFIGYYYPTVLSSTRQMRVWNRTVVSLSLVLGDYSAEILVNNKTFLYDSPHILSPCTLSQIS